MPPVTSTLEAETTSSTSAFLATLPVFKTKRQKNPADLQQVLLFIAELDRIFRQAK